MKYFGRTTVILLTTLALAASTLAILEATDTTHFFEKDTATNIDYGPPSDAAIRDSESIKSQAPDNSTSSPSGKSSDTTSDGNKKTATVEISTWAQTQTTLNINGFVSGIIESNGTCTLKLVAKSDNTIVTQSRQAAANVTNTSCGVSEVPLTKLHSGVWTATLGYSSSGYSGTSEPLELEVK